MAEEEELIDIQEIGLVHEDREAPYIIVDDDQDVIQPSRPVPNILLDRKDLNSSWIDEKLTADQNSFTEDGGESVDAFPATKPTLSIKHAKPVARNFSEVFTKKTHPAERMSSVPDMRTKLATRSSLSRCGSRVQDVPRPQIDVKPKDSALDFLRCTTHNEEKEKQLQKIIDKSNSTLQKHRTKSDVLKLCIKTNSYEKAYKKLKEKRSILITGKAGKGKTHLSLDILMAFMEEFQDYKPMIIETPFDLTYLEDTAACIVVYADGLLGDSDSLDPAVNGWRHIVKYITTLIKRKRICFIFSSNIEDRDNMAYKTLLVNGLLHEDSEICLDDKEFELTHKQQNKMLTLYSKHFCKPLYTNPNAIDKYVQCHDQSLGFPLVCTLVGMGGSPELFANPYHALCDFIAEQHDHHFSSFFLLVLVLITEENCSLLQFQHENHSTFQKLSEVLKSSTCTHSEVCIGLTRLKRQNILYEEESGDISYTHEIIATAVLNFMLTNYNKDELIPLLPLKVTNSLMLLPNWYFQHLNPNVFTLKQDIESSTVVLRAIVSRFSDILDSKRPIHFLKVAMSPVWMLSSFVDILYSVLGFQFFFIEDIEKTPLSAYLVRVGNVAVIAKLVDYMLAKPPQIVSMMGKAIENTKAEACRCNEYDTVIHLLKLSDVLDVHLVNAAIEGGDKDILDLIWPDHLQVASRDMLQLACKSGTEEVFNYIFSKFESGLNSRPSKLLEMRKQNSKGETLLHYAAVGGNTAIFDYLLNQRCDQTVHTHEGNTVLHLAAMFGRYELVRLLCSRFPDLLREKNNLEFTCIHLAAREGHGDVLQSLVARESSIKELSKGENTVLHLAAANGHTEIIRFILRSNSDQQNVTNDKGFIPVQMAIKYGMIETLKLFLQSGTSSGTKTVDNRTFLHLASYFGQMNVVKFLCTTRPELLKEVDIEGNTVGHDAAASGNVSVMTYLIEKGFDPLSRNKYETTLLHEASFHGHFGMVKYLSITFPDLLCTVNASGYTACFGAAICGSVEILKFLVDKGVDTLHPALDGSTVLHESAFSGKLEIVQHLCTTYPQLLKTPNNKSYLPCHFAAQEGHLEVLDVLLTGMKPPLPTTDDNQTLLHIASYNGMLHIVKYLSKKFPSITSALDNEGSLATHYAARGNDVQMLQFLLDQGLRPDAGTQSGSTILHLAAYDGNADMVSYLCEKYPQLIHVQDTTGYSAAHYAAGSGNIPLLLNILQYGIDPHIKSSNGSTLLLKAVYNGRKPMVKYLCTEYPDLISMTDAFGCNVLHYAACDGNVKIIKYMIDKGVNPASRTNDGHTILHVAAFHGQLEVIRQICEDYPNLVHVKDNSGKTAEETATEHNRTKAANLIRSLSVVNQVEITDSVLLSDVCCCLGTNCFGGIWRAIGNICCCGRRGQ